MQKRKRKADFRPHCCCCLSAIASYSTGSSSKLCPNKQNVNECYRKYLYSSINRKTSMLTLLINFRCIREHWVLVTSLMLLIGVDRQWGRQTWTSTYNLLTVLDNLDRIIILIDASDLLIRHYNNDVSEWCFLVWACMWQVARVARTRSPPRCSYTVRVSEAVSSKK